MWTASRSTVFMVTHDVDEAIVLSDRVTLMTSAPEARLAELVDVTLPRPRSRAELLDEPEYLRLRAHILRFLVDGARPARGVGAGTGSGASKTPLAPDPVPAPTPLARVTSRAVGHWEIRRRRTMDRAAALEKVRGARVARGITYEDLGKAIGTKDPTYIAAALHGQHRLNADEAKRLAAAVGIDVETAMATTAMPLRTDFPLTTDPFKYRLMELGGVYGDALRERCNELFGDGILSAIDCVVKLEKKGERGVLTIDAKFLHYKDY
jgi:cyanate lyase